MRKGPWGKKVTEPEAEASLAPKADPRAEWQAYYLGEVGERLPWEELALGAAEYPELLRVIKAILRKEFLKAQKGAFSTDEADVWKRYQGMGRGFEIALEAVDTFEKALAHREEGDDDAKR